MARRRVTAKQRAASRRNIRKAQIASARKRRATPNKRTVSRRPLRDVGSVRASTARKQMPKAARMPVQRKASRKATRRRIAKGVSAALVVGAAGAYGYDLHKNVRLYHNTDGRYVAGIKAHGLHGVQRGSFSHTRFQETPGDVFFAKGINTTKMFGDHVVKVKMNRKEFNRHARVDEKMPRVTRSYKINESHVAKNRPGVKYRVYKGGRMQKKMYRAMFPDGTKESYNPNRNR